ncbi:MAG: hypothetical protein CO186_12865 [Zetaproteobacteria bacterium CG_4_9_14_3_um_filter_49_83]|nr:MAG: hypothetical protein COW62_06805 [Zetaproteobacteria bacterium CG17_big_fil_post_rev_8_21_14_2_50_50_13]PIV29873.1 MAG: hypothetical protein COS35_09795 [Zetaproteobacteria bacterium CG02_land_8_20_14_3_00_50_9]PJA33770.1 MAG: hypothetical protein CO186_12865 [Zetaproteobacteria bacterium CG_4_9_14_3_um_filter_49_83]
MKRYRLICLLLFIAIMRVYLPDATAYDNVPAQISMENQKGFYPYKPAYFGYTFTSSNKDYVDELKIQFSAKYQIVHDVNLFLAYTQTSFLSIRKASSPFREHNFSPELFYQDRDTGYDWLPAIQYGIFRHESTGEAGNGSYAYDTSYIEPTFLIGECLYVMPRVWFPSILQGFSKNKAASENIDIFKYYGYGDLTLIHNIDSFSSHQLKLRYAPIDRSTTYQYQLNISPNSFFSSGQAAKDSVGKFANAYFFIQWRNGYGYGLKTYNTKTSGFIVGMNLVY